MDKPPLSARAGLTAAIAAYAIWGAIPLFIQLLAFATPQEIVAQRILFSLPVAAAIVWFGGQARDVRAALKSRSILAMMGLSGALIAVNWLVFAHAVNAGQVLSASLAYFLTPLAQIALGVLVFKDPISRFQIGALAFAAAGLAMQVLATGFAVWIPILLCATWTCYGWTRKVAPVAAAPGLLIETILLAPFAALGLFELHRQSGLAFGDSLNGSLLLAVSGLVTAIPLVLFTMGARVLRFSTIGVLQFSAPTVQFVIGVLQGEPVSASRLISFILIWIGLGFFAADAMRRYKQA